MSVLRSPLTATLLAISSLTVMSGAAVAPALPSLRDAYGGGEDVETLSKLVLTLPALLIALTAPLSGRVVDRFGRRGPLAIALVLYAAAGSAGLWLPTGWGIEALLAARALLGVATGAVMTIATTLIGDTFEGDERNRVLAAQNVAMAGGGVVFLLASGALVGVGWRWPFAIYLASLLTLAASRAFIGEASPQEESAAEPAREPFPWRAAARIWALATLLMVLFYTVPTQFPFYLESLGVTSGLLTGLAVACATAGGVFASPFAGPVRGRIGEIRTSALVFGAIAAGLGLAWSAHFADAAYPLVSAGCLLIGLATGLMMPTLSGWLLGQGSPAHRVGLVSGLTSALFTGQFISPLVTEPLQRAFGIDGLMGVAGGAAALLAAALTIAGWKWRAR